MNHKTSHRGTCVLLGFQKSNFRFSYHTAFNKNEQFEYALVLTIVNLANQYTQIDTDWLDCIIDEKLSGVIIPNNGSEFECMSKSKVNDYTDNFQK